MTSASFPSATQTPARPLGRLVKWLTAGNATGTDLVSGTPIGLLLALTVSDTAYGTPIGLLLTLTQDLSITNPNSEVVLGSFAPNFWVWGADVHVTEAFNGGSDALTIGHSADNDAYATTVDLSTTGVTSLDIGGIDDTARIPTAYYTASSTPTTGKALIILKYFRTPNS